ncbi:hypothetical protein DYL61_03590 [Pseudomonas nabeulensis]|uniref:Uncharacterized protein n=1 Tax=Pseudomonas nabeulensis TaxID=2293833 RepID=A0A4Z0BAZ7_9PSED|nr:hypothetical protein DYL61_03590 [Pseudomonas nabeulensis]
MFELKLSSTVDYGYQQALSKTTKGEQAGTLGSYSFDYLALPQVHRKPRRKMRSEQDSDV